METLFYSIINGKNLNSVRKQTIFFNTFQKNLLLNLVKISQKIIKTIPLANGIDNHK